MVYMGEYRPQRLLYYYLLKSILYVITSSVKKISHTAGEMKMKVIMSFYKLIYKHIL
jgi:hypothetical protein